MGVEFLARSDGSVEARFNCNRSFQSYENTLRGGVISTLLDGAMTHCLFAHGKTGVTARLIVRFLHPLFIDQEATIRARMCEYSPPLYVLEAELVQDGKIRTKATAKFMDRQ
jgi:acyl-coenzyme A thioesterase PaaI-like protein